MIGPDDQFVDLASVFIHLSLFNELEEKNDYVALVFFFFKWMLYSNFSLTSHLLKDWLIEIDINQ